MIKVDEDGVIRMHDQLWDIDRKFVETKIIYKDTQIWIVNEEVLDVISKKVMNLKIIQMVCIELIMIGKNKGLKIKDVMQLYCLGIIVC